MLMPGKIISLGILSMFVCMTGQCQDAVENYLPELDGAAVMEQIFKRHEQYPYVYEEQSIVLVDHRGRRNTRKAKRYSRVETDGSVQFLLTFHYPQTVKGVSVLARRYQDGTSQQKLYLPALGERLISSNGNGGESKFLGTDFTVECLTGDDVEQYQYRRQADKVNEKARYFVLDVYAKNDSQMTRILKRHYIRQDIFFIAHTDFFNRQGEIEKQQSFHDIKPVNGDMWRADMILLHDLKARHQSLIKIDRRVFSLAYVPEEIFSADWLYEQFPHVPPEQEIDDLSDILPEDLQNGELSTSTDAGASS